MQNSLDDALQRALQLHRQGKLEPAEAFYRQILAAQPNQPAAAHLLALLCHQSGRSAEALQHLAQAINRHPREMNLHQARALILRDTGQWAEAAAALRQLIALNPRSAATHYDLGLALTYLNRSDEAISAFQQAVACDPNLAPAHYNLASLLDRQGDFAAAETHYRRTLHLNAQHDKAAYNLAVLLRLQDRLDEARSFYDRALTAGSTPNIFRQLERDTLFPLLPPDAAALVAGREALSRALEKYPPHSIKLTDQPDKFAAANGLMTLYLSYHNVDDRALKERYASIFTATLPASPPPQPAGGKYRLGVVVTSRHENIFMRAQGDLFNRIDAARFNLTVLCAPPSSPFFRARFSNPDIHILPLPSRPAEAITAIRAAAFDLLYFWEIGSDALNYFLPFFRLAPVQCTGWGSMTTTGIAQVDYFLSSAYFEAPSAQARYTEQLVLLEALPSCFTRPALPEPLKSRAAFNLPQQAHLYSCPQTALKFHPDFDAVLAQILRRDPAGLLLVFADKLARTERLLARWQQVVPDVAARIRVLPRLAYADYLNVLALADVLLDTPYFNGGVTTFEALSVGTPLVTLPGQSMVGRVTQGCYRKMGVLDAVAHSPQQYVDIAVKLATESAFNRQLRQQILAANHLLYEDAAAVRALEAFCQEAIEKVNCVSPKSVIFP